VLVKNDTDVKCPIFIGQCPNSGGVVAFDRMRSDRPLPANTSRWAIEVGRLRAVIQRPPNSVTVVKRNREICGVTDWRERD